MQGFGPNKTAHFPPIAGTNGNTTRDSQRGWCMSSDMTAATSYEGDPLPLSPITRLHLIRPLWWWSSDAQRSVSSSNCVYFSTFILHPFYVNSTSISHQFHISFTSILRQFHDNFTSFSWDLCKLSLRKYVWYYLHMYCRYAIQDLADQNIDPVLCHI